LHFDKTLNEKKQEVTSVHEANKYRVSKDNEYHEGCRQVINQTEYNLWN